MKNVKILGSILQLCFTLTGLLWLGALAVRAADYYVRPSATCTNTDLQSPYTSWDTAATNIQWAVNVATTNVPATVWVSNGTYCLTNQIEIMNNITVQSTNGYSNTLVYASADNTVRCFYVSRTGIVDGFTISNGHFIGSNEYSGGGGAWVATNGRIQNCYFVNNICSNAAQYGGGGGVFVQKYGIVSNCTFYSNTAYQYITGTYTGSTKNYGGGICVKDGLAVGCIVISNYVLVTGGWKEGGGIGVLAGTVSNCFCAYNTYAGIYIADGDVKNCVISNNPSFGVFMYGGRMKDCLIIKSGNRGVRNEWGCSLTNCVITGSSAGGIYAKADSSDANSIMVADNCVISNNTIYGGSEGGGGCFILKGAILRNCLICNNTNKSTDGAHGGGLYLTNAASYTNGIFNCTIVHNGSRESGGGIYVAGTTSNSIVNCVIASNFAPDNVDVYNVDLVNTNNFYYCCVNTNLAPNQGNITNDPSFVNSSAGNWRLANNSPCINTGTNMSWMINSFDLDGRTRIRYGTVDMGAYERINEGTIYGFR